MRRLTSLLFAVLLLAAGGRAEAQVRRCQGPSGEAIYTDRSCEAVGGTEYRAPARPATARATWTCARTVRDLAFEITSAIDNGNPDGLVRLYDWDGVDGDRGYRIAERLAALAERPLIGISAIAPDSATPDDGQFLTTARRPPVALRLQQVGRDGSSVASTVLGLHKRLGCWWIRL